VREEALAQIEPDPLDGVELGRVGRQEDRGEIGRDRPYHWTQVVNIKRDPFETSIGEHTKTLEGVGGALAGPVTAYVYDWNLLPIGQALWLKELRTYIDFPALQNPASYNLDQVIQQIQEMKTAGRSE
jgi:hypothetical protein